MKKYIKADITYLEDEDFSTLLDIVKNPSTRPSTLAKLANKQNSIVVSEVAKNPNTPVDTLRAIYSDAESRSYGRLNAFSSLAENPKLPSDLVDLLLNCNEDEVRMVVASCHDFSAEQVNALLAKQDNAINYGLKFNSCVSEELKKSLYNMEPWDICLKIYIDFNSAGLAGEENAIAGAIESCGLTVFYGGWEDIDPLDGDDPASSEYVVYCEYPPTSAYDARIQEAITNSLKDLGCTDIEFDFDTDYTEYWMTE